MKSIPRPGVYLDKRYKNQKGWFPVKIKVSYRRKTCFYKTGILLTEEAFRKSYKANSPHGQAFILKEEIQGHFKKAGEIIKRLHSFSFGEFERSFYDVPQEEQDIFSLYDQIIKENIDKGSFSNSEFYRLSKAKLVHYFAGSHSVPFDRIDSVELAKIDKWLRKRGLGDTSISIYFRCLKHIFNIAVKKGLISINQNPFNSAILNPYYIPTTRNIKKPLTLAQLKVLIDYVPVTESAQEKAKDFWLLSFYCNGMNINDLLQLRNKDYNESKISFIRGKTKGKTRQSIKIMVEIVESAARIIDKYRNPDISEEAYLFPVLDSGLDAAELRRGIKNFTKMINQHMKKIALSIGLPREISCYWARYTFSNLAKNRGISTEFIQEALGHTDMKTTEIYLDSFEDSVRKETTLRIFDGL